jgi:hypothetical protein
VSGLEISTVGLILMICGVLGLVLTLFLMRGGAPERERTVARDREPY